MKSWTSRHTSPSVVSANFHLQQSNATVHKAGVAMLQLAVLSSCGCTCRTDRWEDWRGSINAFVLGPCHHKLLPASAFGSCCITVRNEIPPFSSVARTTVPWPSTPFSISWPSSVVLSNCSPSSARWGSASTRGIIVDASFYATTPSPKQCSRLFTSVESFTLHIKIVLDIPTSAAVYTVLKRLQSNGSICSTVQCFFVPSFQRHLVYKHVQQQPFYGPSSRTTRVSRYQKKHSPTHHL